jgi:hypothetical protein
MKFTAVVALMIRLFSVGLIIYLIRVLLSEFSAYTNFDSYSLNIVVVLVVAFIVLLAGFLWKFPLFLAKILIDFGSFDDEEMGGFNEKSIYTLSFVLLSTLLLYWALSDTVYWWFWLSAQAELSQYTNDFSAQQKASVFATVAEGVFAILLIVGSGQISRFVLWLRRAGT